MKPIIFPIITITVTNRIIKKHFKNERGCMDIKTEKAQDKIAMVPYLSNKIKHHFRITTLSIIARVKVEYKEAILM